MGFLVVVQSILVIKAPDGNWAMTLLLLLFSAGKEFVAIINRISNLYEQVLAVFVFSVG